MLHVMSDVGLLPPIASSPAVNESETTISLGSAAAADLPDDAPTYIPAPKFEGSKPGYYFKKGPQGLGYYIDN